MASGSDCSTQLENQIETMSNYLEKLVIIDDKDEKDEGPCDAQELPLVPVVYTDYYQSYSAGGFIPGSSYVMPGNSNITTGQNFPQFSYPIPDAPLPNPGNTITSLLANPSITTNPNKLAVLPTQSSEKRRTSNKYTSEDFDSSNIDINETMLKLGLTPELFCNSDVHKLFNLFSDLEYSLNAEYISQKIYDQKTLPNTLSVSAQIKHAVWCSHKLLRNLREILQRPLPYEFTEAFNECLLSLQALQEAIVGLESFKNCNFEHRKGEFITRDGKEYLQPLMNSLNRLSECVQQSRMYCQVFERALNAPERYKRVALASQKEKEQQTPTECSPDKPSTSRQVVARRYIG